MSSHLLRWVPGREFRFPGLYSKHFRLLSQFTTLTADILAKFTSAFRSEQRQNLGENFPLLSCGVPQVLLRTGQSMGKNAEKDRCELLQLPVVGVVKTLCERCPGQLCCGS